MEKNDDITQIDENYVKWNSMWRNVECGKKNTETYKKRNRLDSNYEHDIRGRKKSKKGKPVKYT